MAVSDAKPLGIVPLAGAPRKADLPVLKLPSGRFPSPGSGLLLGRSRASCDLDAFIQRAAATAFPALILGEPGSETEEVACAIHARSLRRGEPFISLDGARLEAGSGPGEIVRSMEQAQGGTFHLSRIHRLPPTVQSWLAGEFRSRVNLWLAAGRARGEPRVRLIASSRPDLDQWVERRDFDYRLLGELDFLRISIPPLRLRPEDVRLLAACFLEHLAAEDTDALAPEVWEALERYSWPFNVLELRCLVGRLLAMTSRRPIRLEDVHPCAPQLLAPAGSEPRPAEVRPQPRAVQGSEPSRVPWSRIEDCARGREPQPPVDHESLQRALAFLSGPLDEKLSLDDLARSSHTSPSHLSFLFKARLEISPMLFVAAVKVTRARDLLQAPAGRSVTEIAAAVGFGDLRHFERTFKRWFGVTPSRFRNALRAHPLPPEDPPDFP